MSRVDDDYQARKLMEQLALKKANEQKHIQKQQGESVFAAKLSQSKPQEAEVRKENRSVAQEAFDRLMARAGKGSSGEAQAARERPQVMGSRLQQTEQKQTQGTAQDDASRLVQHGQQKEVKQESARETRTQHEERGKGLQQTSDRSALAADGKAEGLRTEGDQNRGGQGGSDSQKDQGGGQRDGSLAAASFRFNPALMAPTPVARPRETANSDRLRAIANEIAQKIVERVRVGTNKAGASEFQIDLRGNVLGGLSIKISARNGRINAAFQGADREVMKLLEANTEQLRTTLTGRGLTLGDVSFEDRA